MQEGRENEVSNTPSQVPSQIARHSATEMLVEWKDEGKFALPFRALRFHCPCAGCVNEITGQRMITLESIKPDVQPIEVRLVGRYAVQVDWNDGHSTGMYSFERLKDLSRELGHRVAP